MRLVSSLVFWKGFIMAELQKGILNEFISMARKGVSASADLDEQAAYRMAMAVIDDASLIGEDVLKGFAAFTALSHRVPDRMRAIVDGDQELDDLLA